MKDIIFLFGSYASLGGVLFALDFDFTNKKWWFWVIVTIAIIFVILSVISVIKEALQRKQFTPKSPKIQKFLVKWLGGGGNCAIFTRNMTWAQGKTIKPILEEKAKNSELTIFYTEENKTIKSLEKMGANIHKLDDLITSPKSRFTVIDWQRDGAKIAVGRREKGKHVIREYSQNDHPLFAVVEDLLELALNYGKKNKPKK